MRYVCATLALGFAIVSTGSGGLRAAQQDKAGAAPSISPQQALINQYCVTCHNQRSKTANVMFDTMDLSNVSKNADIWEKAVRKLRGGMMPPPGARQPERAAVDGLAGYLETALDRAAAANPNPGRVAIHRMNRAEYANVIEDLLGVRIDASALLPKDDQANGFDNIANVLKVSPSFLDQYISAARFVTNEAIGNSTPKTASTVLRVPRSVDQSVHIEGLPLGTRGGFVVEHSFPADGEYKFNINGLASGGYVRGLEYEHNLIITIDGNRVWEKKVGGEQDIKAIDQKQAPAIADINGRFQNIMIPVKAGPHKVGVTFVARSYAESDDTLQSFVPGKGEDRIARISSVEVLGPYNSGGITETPNHKSVFVCHVAAGAAEAEQTACAKQILSAFAKRAYRRPVTDRDLVAPLAFYKSAKEDSGGDFDAGIKSALTAVLSSPKFLYRAEVLPDNAVAGESYRVSDLDLASRLSFFLWSRLPDDELLNSAAQGKLNDSRNPKALEQEMRRMLADPKSKALVTNFAFQWLKVRNIDEIDPDVIQFPNFDESLREAFKHEMELFVDSVFREDRSVVDLLTANYTFLNERLALHYGVPNVRGDRFRRVTLDDPNRYGLLGKGSLLMVTSYPNRTAPVLRGAFVLENIMGTPPSPPPPDVEGFKENKEGEKAKTVREIMEKHRANPTCNNCHGVMDPLGFSLENFDALGAWRAKDVFAGTAIDASGKLVDGTAVTGPSDLRQALLKHPEQFVQTMTEKMMTYALGRAVEYYDMPTIRKIVRDAAKDNYRFSSIVLGIVSSPPFQMKRMEKIASN
jgi:mono/diheme cytochrome c family protein